MEEASGDLAYDVGLLATGTQEPEVVELAEATSELHYLSHSPSPLSRSAPSSPVEEASEDPAYVVGLLATAFTFILGYYAEEAHIHWIPEAGIGVLLGAL